MSSTTYSTTDDRKELEVFLQTEQIKQRFQQQVHEFTDLCWDKCVTKVNSNKLDKNEEQCLGYCVDRFLDTGNLILKRLESMTNN
ncbi:hypothetical protein MP638_000251 [Amoeboaphelidium occidentale]|nr:hypothetical protein MP638_000251 [Amoeboaphelidium occidentale]